MSHKVVISGMSGQFPECSNVDDFKTKLFAKETSLKGDASFCNENSADGKAPNYFGKMFDWKKFDATFFGMHPKLAKNSDPNKGLLLERTFEAIMDSGINPFNLKGHKIGVVTGNSVSEAEVTRFAEGSYLEGNGMIGHSRTMQPNRISYFFNFTGPSYNVDTSSSSAILALEKARAMVADGTVEAAVVGSVNLFNLNSVNVEYQHLNYFSPTGQCFPFDEKAQGFVRSEGVVVFFLQRAQDAKRSYCTVVKCNDNYLGDRTCGFIEMDSTYETFLKEYYYSGEDVNPDEVCYVEANSCAHKDIDALELNAIAKTFERKKESPLLIGSVAGNVGNGDAVAGFFSMVKSIIAMECGTIPATINYSSPNPKVPALLDGSLKPVTEPTELRGNTVAVANVNVLGSVDHVVLKRHNKTKKALSVGELPQDGLHRLVTFQARHEQGANHIMQQIASMAVDTDFVSLVNDVFKTKIPAYMWRGYTLLPLDKQNLQSVAECSIEKRPLWYIFSGMGSQWIGMGEDLLQFPVFSAAIDKCDKVLRPRGLDIKQIITGKDPRVFDNILNCFVGIAAIQVGLVDLLCSVGVSPDGMIGHSVGELGCAYADGCFTAEETVLGAYARGKASLESSVISGMMAAVGLGYKDMKDKLPETIDVACHNSASSCTLSGPSDDVNAYVDQLKKQGVFARAVSAGGIAYHSRYIKSIAPKLLQYLKETITSPKARSSKWVSSSVPESQWGTKEAQLCSAEYHTNNLLSPVLFEEACTHLPSNAIALEIAPRGLLQAILKRSMGSGHLNLSLTERNAQTNVVNVLNTLGQLYVNGVDVNVNSLFPTVEYPVARNTQSLAKLITWEHKDAAFGELTLRIDWLLKIGKKDRHVDINPNVPGYEDWKNLKMNGLTHIPLSCLLEYPWRMIFATKKINMSNHCVTLENVAIRNYFPVLEEGRTIVITFAETSSNFELSIFNENEAYDIFLVGKLYDSEAAKFNCPVTQEDQSNFEDLNREEVYSILERFEYQLSPEFQIIERILLGEKECLATLIWTGELKWFLEALFHVVMTFLTDKQQRLMLPACWNKMHINVPLLKALKFGSEVKVHYDMRCNRLVCEGVELLGLVLSPATSSWQPSLTWKEVKLQPYMNSKLSEKDFLSLSFQLATEVGLSSWTRNVVHLDILAVKGENLDDAEFVSKIRNRLVTISNIESKISEVDLDSAKMALSTMGQRCCLVAGEFNTIVKLASDLDGQYNGYFLVYVNSNNGLRQFKAMRPVLTYASGEANSLVLLKKEISVNKLKTFELKSTDWLSSLRQRMEGDTSDNIVIVFTQELTPSEVLPTLANERFSHRVRTVFIEDDEAPQFSLNSSFYSSQLTLGLPVNILSGKLWNSRRALELDVKPYTTSIDILLESKHSEEIKINFIGLNTKYLSVHENSAEQVSKLASSEIELVDYSGWLEGHQVMGIAEYNISEPKVKADSVLNWEIPELWTLEDAVTVPVTYSLAFYCILLEGKLQTGESILVNAKMSLLGQALVNISLHLGAQVFVSVEDDDEAIALHKLFPSLNCEHVVVLHRQNLKDRIRKLTKGKGVDLIINDHGGKLLKDAVSLSADFGRFVHLSCTKVGSGEIIGLESFFKNNFVKAVNVNCLINCDVDSKTRLRDAIKTAIDQGIITPFNTSVFTPSQQSDALNNIQLDITKKTIIVANGLQLRNEKPAAKDCIQVIVSEKDAEFLLDLAEWLVEQGCRKLIVLTGEDQLNDNHLRRFSRLIESKKLFIAFASTTRLDTHDNAACFFKELMRVATITSVFCMGLNEDEPIMKNLDSASRELLPKLREFVSLLGEGAAVSESRATNGFSVMSIQSQVPLRSPKHILPYLAALLAESKPDQAKFFVVEEKLDIVVTSDTVDFTSFLPKDLNSLIEIASELRDVPSFNEEATLSPRYQHVCKTLLPVFVVPGLSSHCLRPLIQQLIHPAFSCSLPSSINSIHQFAEILLQKIENVQAHGPYHIIGESWNGIVALTLSCMLEASGHKVELFLIEAVPSVAEKRVKSLCNHYGKDLETSLVSALSFLPQVTEITTRLKESDANLQSCLNDLSVETRKSASRAVTSLYTQLDNLTRNQSSSYPQFKGNLTVITHRPLASTDVNLLSKVSVKAPKIVTTLDESYQTMLSSAATASIINENITFTWNM